MIDLFGIGDDYIFRLNNLVLLLLSALFLIIGRKIVRSRFRKSVEGKGITIQGKEVPLSSLITQGITVVTIFFGLSALGYNNDSFSIQNVLNYELISNNGIPTAFQLTIRQIVYVFIILFTTRIVINVVKVLLFRYFKGRNWLDESKRYTFIQLSRYVIYTIGIVIALKILVGNITGVLIGASALFVGLGLGLREFFTDIIGGLVIFTEGKIKVHDIIELNGEPSRVDKINLRTTELKTLDGKALIVPNSKLTQDSVVNWSLSEKATRFCIDVNVAYGSDTEKVRSLLYDAALKHSKVDKKLPITIMIADFNERGIHFQLFFWSLKTWESPLVKSDIRFAIDKSFKEYDIHIPGTQIELKNSSFRNE
jgi:small-conductance mechanosensitive channel